MKCQIILYVKKLFAAVQEVVLIQMNIWMLECEDDSHEQVQLST